MKKLLQDVLAPVCLFSFGLLLLGCDQPNQPSSTSENNLSQPEQNTTLAQSEYKSGDMLYIIRDVADFQLKAGNYLEPLQQTQQHIKEAIHLKDQIELKSSTIELKQQLTQFNETLNQLNLKSQEINDIRQNVISTNQKVLNSPLLNGELNFSENDFKKIEQQIGNVQTDMLQLAKMLVQNNNSSTTLDSEKQF